jgi:TolB-like protein/predicted Zn-dependent protease
VGLISELRRRNVLRMAVLYVLAAWLVMQVAEVIIGLANLPDWAGPTVLALLAIGFPIALIFSWFYELTPEGIALEKDVEPGASITHVTGRRLDFIVIAMLAAAVILFAWDKWWVPGPPEKSVAVLPFVNLSGDPEQDYFSDGLSEELLNLLTQLPDVYVPARTSSFYFKGKNENAADIAAALNVSHLLEGSVRRSGDRIRISAQLIRAENGFRMWSRIYDRELSDVFAVQEEIAAAITDALEVTLGRGGDGAPPATIRTASIEAYDAYLKGRELTRLRAHGYLNEAIDHLEHALRLDADFAPAHAQLAIATLLLTNYGDVPLDETRQQALPHLERALELEPELAEAHTGLGLLAGLSGDYESEVRHTQRALAINPSYGDALNGLQIAYQNLGRFREADALLEQLIAVDPLNVVGRWNYAEVLNETGRTGEAHAVAESLMQQNAWWGYAVHGQTALHYEGRIAEALYWALKEAEMFFPNPRMNMVFFVVGEYDEARRVIALPKFWIDARADGNWDVDQLLAEDPDDADLIEFAAILRYEGGRYDDALPYFERLLALAPADRPIPAGQPLVQTMRLALLRRRAGNEAGAQEAAEIVRRDLAALQSADRRNRQFDMARAASAAFDGDKEKAIDALESSVDHGLRAPWMFDDPLFEDIRDDRRFIAVKENAAELLAGEHDKVLQLICFNNPTPDNWQPLPETCEGVVERPL